MRFKELDTTSKNKRFRIVGDNLYEYEKVNNQQAMITRVIFDGPENIKSLLSPSSPIVQVDPETSIVLVAAA